MCFLRLLPRRQLAWGGRAAPGTDEMWAASSAQPLREGAASGGHPAGADEVPRAPRQSDPGRALVSPRSGLSKPRLGPNAPAREGSLPPPPRPLDQPPEAARTKSRDLVA